MTLYLDLDGVLADFDSRAEAILGTDNIYKYEYVYGTDTFWRAIHKGDPCFFENLSMMPDADELWDATRHVNPVILTALPKSGANRVDEQKRQWVARHLSPAAKVITCLAHEKPNYCEPGDVLVDDRAVNRAAWEAKGGRFVVHTDARRTINELRSMGVI